MTLGEIIKKYRSEYGLTIEQFSEKCGLSKSYISMLEANKDPRGNSISPSIDTISKVATSTDSSFESIIKALDIDQQRAIKRTFENNDTFLPLKWAQMYSCLDEKSKNSIHQEIEKKYNDHQQYLKEYKRITKLPKIDTLKDAKIFLKDAVAFEGTASHNDIILAANAILQYERNRGNL